MYLITIPRKGVVRNNRGIKIPDELAALLAQVKSMTWMKQT
jgi:hypothetical protein